MTEYRLRERELDNQLLLELDSKSPDEGRIRKLVQVGADVNSTKNGESVLMDALEMIPSGLDLQFIRLLVELGADVNFMSDEGDSPLITACFTHEPKSVECLLRFGANPNHIFSKQETLLSWANSDKFYHETVEPDRIAVAQLEHIIKLLQQYGAKCTNELFTNKVSNWLRIYAGFPTGLLTLTGNIEIVSLPGVSDELIDEFICWRYTHWDAWPNKVWEKIPKGFNRQSHNKWGRKLAKQISELFSENVKIEYLSIGSGSDEKKSEK